MSCSEVASVHRPSLGGILRKLKATQRRHIVFLNKLQSQFYGLGRVIGLHPFLFIFFSLLLALSSNGLIYLRFAQKLQDGFVDRHSLAKIEQTIKADFEGEQNLSVQRFVVLIRRKDEGNMLNRKHMADVRKIFDFISNNITVQDGSTIYKQSQLCGKYCDMNELLWGFQKCVEGVYMGADVLVDHPQSKYGNYGFLVAANVFGVKRKDVSDHEATTTPSLDEGQQVFIPYNEENPWPVSSNRTHLLSVSLMSLYFLAPLPNDTVTNVLTKWEDSVFEWSKTQTDFPGLQIHVMGDKVLSKEMVRGGWSLIPHLIAGCTVVLVFVTAMVILNASKVRKLDWTLSLIVFGIIVSPILAFASAFGLMGFFGAEIYPVQLVIPFLILAIGVDDAFLMSHAWDRIAANDEFCADKKMKNAIIFARVLEEVGPSITITSLTNALAFGIGVIFTYPAMQLFCISAAIAIILDFIFEITFFGSLLVLSGRKTKHQDDDVSQYKEKNNLADICLNKYCNLLTNNFMRFLVMVGTVIYLGLSLYGTITIETKIDSQKIIPHDSPLKESDRLFKDFYWMEYEPLQIFVNNPPDISNAVELARLEQMIKDFENMPKAIGAKSTMIWLKDYKEFYSTFYSFLNVFGGKFSMSDNDLEEFVNQTPAGAVWNRTIKWHREENGIIKMDSFYFLTGTHNSTTWMERAENMLRWREVAANYPDFNVTCFSENSAVFEGIFGLAGQTTITALLTLLSMVIVCLFFLPGFIGVFFSALAISSISVGVLGSLSLTGMDLDPVTMSAIVMSIGFSVDYTAHVSYHYTRAWSVLPRSSTSADCVHYTISAVGWPMVEAAASTLVCFLPVIFHPDYTPTVFLRAIFFVVLYGVLHGLIILPTFLSMMPRSSFDLDVSPPQKAYLEEQRPLPLVADMKHLHASSQMIQSSTSSSLTPNQSQLDTSSYNSSNDTTLSLLTENSASS